MAIRFGSVFLIPSPGDKWHSLFNQTAYNRQIELQGSPEKAVLVTKAGDRNADDDSERLLKGLNLSFDKLV
jgi:hypothetical protein